MNLVDMVFRLLVAVGCSAAIGFERETAQKVAGLRTHTLVGVGAATFTIVSIIGFSGGDEARVAAQIVTGIGFLGAGAIFREGAFVTGLTTAAGLWTVAAVGMAAGAGSYALALISTLVVMAVLLIFHRIDASITRRRARVKDKLRIDLDDVGQLSPILKFARKIDPDIQQIDFTRLREGRARLVIEVDPDQEAMLSEMIAVLKGVARVEILNPLHSPPSTDTR